MRVVWLRAALIELGEIYSYLYQRNPDAAARVHEAIKTAVEGLADLPHRGRPGRWPGTRELVIPRLPFIVPYRVRGERVEILRVFHAAQQWPEDLEGR